MNQMRPNRRSQKHDAQGIRGLVLTLAVSSTIGFWAIFSRVDGIQSSGIENLDQSMDGLSEIQDENDGVLNLPPIPTLIPTADVSVVSLPAAAMTLPISVPGAGENANPIQIAPRTTANKPDRDRSKPEKQKKEREKKTTSTRSS